MIIGQTLQRSAKALQQGASIEDLVGSDGEPDDSIPAMPRGAAPRQVRRISELPEMVGDEEPLEAFQRLSVRQRRLSE
jgi:hypothetical protein